MLVVLAGTGVGEAGSTTNFTGTSVDAFYDAISQQETETGFTALAYLCGASGEKPSLPNNAILKQYFKAERSPEPLLESLGLNLVDSLSTEMERAGKECAFASGSALIPENEKSMTPLHFLMQRIFKLVLRRPFPATMRRCKAILNEFGSVVAANDCFKADTWGRVPLDLLLGDKMQISALTKKSDSNQIEILKQIVHAFLLDEERLVMLDMCGERTKDKISLLDPPNCWRIKDAVTQTKRDPGPEGKYRQVRDPAFARLNFSMQFADRQNPPDPRICDIELVRYNPPFIDSAAVEHAESQTRYFMKYESVETADVPRPWAPTVRLHTLPEVRDKDLDFFDDISAFGTRWEEKHFKDISAQDAKRQALWGDRRTERNLTFQYKHLPIDLDEGVAFWEVEGEADNSHRDLPRHRS
jgi:hypothetical protein